jgi:type II secretory pathway component PulF
MTTKQRARLYRELGKLIGAGMHLDRSLELLLEQGPASSVRRYLTGLRKGLAEHLSVADSIAKHNGSLVTSIEISLVEAGERGGRLDDAFRHLARYFELKQKAADKALGAMIYPLILLHVGLIFQDVPALILGTDLPSLVPKIVIRFLTAWSLLLGIWIIWSILSKLSHTSGLADRFLCSLPLIGSTRRHWALARFCQVFQTGLLAAMRMSETLYLAGSSSQSALINNASRRAAGLVQQGNTLSSSLKSYGVFSKTFLNSVDTAEQTGSLDVEMERWAEAESEMAAQAQDRVAEWMPRIFYVFVVGFVGYKIISMFQGIYGENGEYMKILKDMP